MKSALILSLALALACAPTAGARSLAAQVTKREFSLATTAGVFDVRTGEKIADARILVGERVANEPPLSLWIQVPLAGRATTAGDVYADDVRVNKRRLALERSEMSEVPGESVYHLDLGEAEARTLLAATRAAIVTEEFRVELTGDELAKVRAAYDAGAK